MIAGCGGGDASNEEVTSKPVTFTVCNRTGAKIIDVGINSNDSRMTPMSYGSIENGVSETLKNNYLPSKIGLHWSKLNKNRTSKDINVSSSLGATYQGPIRLTVQPNGKVIVSK